MIGMVLEPSDVAHLSYYDATNANLKYATGAIGSWTVETACSSVTDVGNFSSIAIDALGNPHIAHEEDVTGKLLYTYKSGGLWSTEVVDTTWFNWWATSLVLDTEGNPCIAFRGWNDPAYEGYLFYARKRSGVWNIELADSGAGASWDLCMAFDSSGEPHIVFSDFVDDAIKHAWRSAGTWHTEMLDSDMPGYCAGISFKIDTYGTLHCVYTGPGGSLRYATKPASTWQVETVDSTGQNLTSASIDVDFGGHPHISYYDNGLWALRYATKFGPAWTLETITGAGNHTLCGHNTFIALTPNGRPRIGYYRAGGANLKYASYPGAMLLVPSEYSTIQAAIDAAYVSDVVVVAPGTYTGPGNRDLDFKGKDIALMSDPGGSVPVIDCEWSARGFHFHSGETYLAVVDRFAVVHGSDVDCGGGLRCDDATPMIVNCLFSDNSAGNIGGGAMYLEGPESPTIYNCTFSDNDGNDGGGIYISNASPILTQCHFFDNYAFGDGGAILCSHVASAYLDSCTFFSNSAQLAGGAICCNGLASSAHLATCTIANNDAGTDGGGMCFSAFGTYPTIDSCTIVGNSALFQGAGLYCENASLPFLNKTIITFSTDGEAVASDGSSPATLQCCDIYGNEGGPGDAGPLIGMSGNFAEDPMFCNLAGGDYRLRYCSPCLDAPDCGHIGAYGLGDCERVWEVPADAPTIQAGIDSATCGDIVMVACDTYHEHDIVMKPGITLTSLTGLPDCVTIDADSLGRVFSCTDITDTTLIRGFTITGGFASGATPEDDKGGGILISGCHPCLTITDCIISSNYAELSGGGIYSETSGATITRCELSGNESDFEGAGISCYYDNTVLDHCLVSRNQAWQQGGGICIGDLSAIRVDSCTLFGNIAPLGGGVYSSSSYGPDLQNTIIAFGNSGGGTGAVSDYYGMITASCCDIYGNVGGPGDAAGWIGANGNFAADPAFCDTAGGDFRLYDYSPCVDTLGCGQVGAYGVGCIISGVTEEVTAIPSKLYLGPARPNPFASLTQIGYGIPGGSCGSRVVVNVYDARGRRVRTLVDAEHGPGMYRVAWDGKDLRGVEVASGVYFYRISHNGRSKTRRMVLLK
jgi:predicted outer membrane repeat protein